MINQLGDHPLFSGLSDGQLEPLASRAVVQEIDPGTTILRADATADTLRLIVEGRVALFMNEGPRATPFETLGPGDAVGLSWLRPDATWAFTAVAWTYVKALAIPAANLHFAMDTDVALRHHVHAAFNQILVSRLHAVRLQHLDLYGSPHAHR